MPEQKKILLMGLDKSGKSSIVLTMNEDTNLMSYLSLKPTLGVEVSKIKDPDLRSDDLTLIWDLGGQQRYRDKYKKQFDMYLTGTERIIYVIDVQDPDRYDLAIEYLKDIIDLISENGGIEFLTLYLHKYDPNIKDIMPEVDEIIEEKLVPKLRNVLPPDLNLNVYKTTIFTAFHRIYLK